MPAIKPLSMRMSLIITIVVVGLLGTSVAWLTGTIYYRLALDSQRDNLQEQLTNRVVQTRHALEELARELGISVSAEVSLKDGWLPLADPQRALRTLMRHPAAKAEHSAITELYLLDIRLGVLARNPLASTEALCGQQRVLAERRRGEERLRTLSGICLHGDRAYHSVIVPLGLPEPRAYLQLLTDLESSAQALESALGTPLRLALRDGGVLYVSPHWAAAQGRAASVRAEHELAVHPATRGPLVLAAVKDIGAVQERLERAQGMVMLGAVVAIFLSALVALAVLQRTTLYPLERLTAQLRRIRADKDHLGQPVDVRGNAEVAELAAGFNAMTAQLKELYASLEHMAFTDPLTGLPNRALFQDRLQQMILAARRDDKPFALLIMDLDHFKEINDTLGHPVGDRMLQEVAQRLRAKLRESDTVARLGGDEFAVLLPTMTQGHAAMAARMLLQALRSPVVIDGHSLEVGGSIGIALHPEHGTEAPVLLRRADIAMYSAKQTHSGFAVYDSRLDHHHPARLALLSELRAAIDQEQFVLHYQPVVNLWSNRVSGAEALLRWQHPREGLLAPQRFVPLLEETGLIRTLTPWVLTEALRASGALRAAGHALPIAVNLSARDLQDPNLSATLLEVLAAQQASPEWLAFEITESTVMTDPERARELLTQLADMGFRLAIDDFGTGYSSLAYLKKLPVRVLKIDKSFVIDMAQDEDDAAIVRTSIELAHNLGLEVVAEGVESEEILRRLAAARCDAAQGMHIGRPATLAELQDWLGQSAWAGAPAARASRA